MPCTRFQEVEEKAAAKSDRERRQNSSSKDVSRVFLQHKIEERDGCGRRASP